MCQGDPAYFRLLSLERHTLLLSLTELVGFGLTPLYVKTRVLSGLGDGLACAEVCHDALVDLSRKEAFQASDDLAFGPAIGGASGDVVAGWLVESHADDDGSIEAQPLPAEQAQAVGMLAGCPGPGQLYCTWANRTTWTHSFAPVGPAREGHSSRRATNGITVDVPAQVRAELRSRLVTNASLQPEQVATRQSLTRTEVATTR